jgi:hypothetical protein
VNDRHRPDRGFDRKIEVLEGWNVDASTVVNELKAEARREDILFLLDLKFPGEVPAECVAAINDKANRASLSTWIIHAAFATSPAEFMAWTRIGRRRRK